MEKSHGGLRVEEFLYLLNFMKPMEHFSADLANMDRHRHLGIKPGAQILDTTIGFN